MGYAIQQNQTARPLVFLMIDVADHVSPKTGLSPTVTLSKNGGAFASPAGAVTEIGSGWYKVAGNATDSNTLGPLLLHATATGADPTDDRFDVVYGDPHAGVDVAKWKGGAVATPNTTGYPLVDIAYVVGQAATFSADPVEANVRSISGDTTAADNLEAMLDGTGGATLSAVLGASAITAASIASDAITAAKIAAGAITSAKFAAGAIDAAAIATGAIDADALAADAGTEIGTAVWASATRTLSSGGLDSITVETGVNARQAISVIAAACAGVASGMEGNTAVLKAAANSGTTRITATTDTYGNRTAVTLSLPA